MNNNITRDFEIENHWKYNYKVLILSLPDSLTKEKALDIMRTLYIESMKHGHGHGLKGEWVDG